MSCRVLDELMLKSARKVEEGDEDKRRGVGGCVKGCGAAHGPQHFGIFRQVSFVAVLALRIFSKSLCASATYVL